MEENDEGLAQVFDSNMDFVSTNHKSSSESDSQTCVKKAFQIPDDNMTSNSEKMSNSKSMIKPENLLLRQSSDVEKEQLIPYEKDSIQVLIQKKKTKPFCRVVAKKPIKKVDSDGLTEKFGGASVASKEIEDDVISEAETDVSSTTSLQSISGDCSMMSGASMWSLKNAFYDLPDVHGARNKTLDAQVCT